MVPTPPATRRLAGGLALPLLLGVLAGCAPTVSTDEFVVGFVLVGRSDDLGYNQAVAEGAALLARRLPNVRVVVEEDVPEDERAVATLEALVADGADLLFATSYGHQPAARAVAEAHPDVVVAQQSNVEGAPALDNLGTYFGAHHELFYEAGITAGAVTESGRLGFVASFPIPAIRRNVGAFLLGARSVRPDAVVDVRLTGSWCDPDAQLVAAEQLLADGADVLGQQQDCTTTVLQAAREGGAYAVGYHADGSEVAGDAWLTAAVWDWADTYVAITETVVRGEFADSVWNGDWRGTVASHEDFPMVRAAYGPAVTEEVAALVDAAHERFTEGAPVFVGPLVDTTGETRLQDGESLTIHQLDALDWVPDGVVGDLS